MTPSHLSVTTATISSNLEHYSQRLEGKHWAHANFLWWLKKRSCTFWPCGLRVKASSNKEVAVWTKPGSQKVLAQPAIKWLLWVFYIGLYSLTLEQNLLLLADKISPVIYFQGSALEEATLIDRESSWDPCSVSHQCSRRRQCTVLTPLSATHNDFCFIVLFCFVFNCSSPIPLLCCILNVLAVVVKCIVCFNCQATRGSMWN